MFQLQRSDLSLNDNHLPTASTEISAIPKYFPLQSACTMYTSFPALSLTAVGYDPVTVSVIPADRFLRRRECECAPTMSWAPVMDFASAWSSS